MNILVTIDRNYLYPLKVLLKSLCISNPNAFFDIYVAHSSLEESDFKELSLCIDEHRMVLHPVLINEFVFDGAPTIKRLSTARASYYRLLAIDFMPKNTKRVLYLDPDIVVINPVSELYNINLNGALMAAAGHTTGVVELFNRTRLHIKKGSRYINSGVILMDIDAMRREYSLNDVFMYIENNSKRLIQGDQDVFNGLYNGKIKILDEKLYNLDEKTYRIYRRELTLDTVRLDSVIIHYNGKYKPWKENYKGVLKGFFDDAAKSGVVPFPSARVI